MTIAAAPTSWRASLPLQRSERHRRSVRLSGHIHSQKPARHYRSGLSRQARTRSRRFAISTSRTCGRSTAISSRISTSERATPARSRSAKAATIPVSQIHRDRHGGCARPPRALPFPQRADDGGLRPRGRRDLRYINYIHPFREGNGRTQLQYLKQLAAGAGHTLDLTRIEGPRWIEASMASHAADYDPVAALLRNALNRAPGGVDALSTALYKPAPTGGDPSPPLFFST